MGMQFTLIVPPSYEAALGLMIGAGEKPYRGKVWRAELWASGEFVRLSCDGRPVTWEAAPIHARKLAIAVCDAFKPAKPAQAA